MPQVGLALALYGAAVCVGLAEVRAITTTDAIEALDLSLDGAPCQPGEAVRGDLAGGPNEFGTPTATATAPSLVTATTATLAGAVVVIAVIPTGFQRTQPETREQNFCENSP